MKRRKGGHYYLEHTKGVVLAGENWGGVCCRSYWWADDAVDLIAAQVVVCVLAIHVMVVDIGPTHKEVAAIYPPEVVEEEEEEEEEGDQEEEEK